MKFISKIRATLTVTAVIATVAMVPQGAYAQSLEANGSKTHTEGAFGEGRNVKCRRL